MAKALALLVIGPVLGVFVGFLVGALVLPDDPNFVANGGHASPGDGFLVLGFGSRESPRLPACIRRPGCEGVAWQTIAAKCELTVQLRRSRPWRMGYSAGDLSSPSLAITSSIFIARSILVVE